MKYPIIQRSRRMLAWLLVPAALVAAAGATSCDDDDDYDTNQFHGGVTLSASQLSLTRGGTMLLKGSGLQGISSIEFTGGATSSDKVETLADGVRFKVPLDALPGPVTLHYNGGTIVTQPVSFTADIAFAGFEPNDKPVEPGQQLTIKGSYLNYCDGVVFIGPEGDIVIEYALSGEPMQNEAKVTIPIDAADGHLYLAQYTTMSDGKKELAKIAILDPTADKAFAAAKPEVTKSTEEAIKASWQKPDDQTSDQTDASTDASTDAGGDAGNKSLAVADFAEGDRFEIEGTLLRLVQAVQFAHNDAIAADQAAVVVNTPDKATEAVAKLSVPVPVYAKEGPVNLVLFNGMSVELTTPLALKKPKPNELDKTNAYAVDANIEIEGTDLDLVTAYTFENFGTSDDKAKNGALVTPDGKPIHHEDGDNKWDEPVVKSDPEKLTLLPLPKMAQSGSILLQMANGESVAVPGFRVQRPKVTSGLCVTGGSYALDNLTVLGANLHRIRAIWFGGQDGKTLVKQPTGADGKVNTDVTSLPVTVPINALSGPVMFELDNDEIVDYDKEFTKKKNDQFCEFVTTAADGTQTAGFDPDKVTGAARGVFRCQIINEGAVTNCKFDGKDTKYYKTKGVDDSGAEADFLSIFCGDAPKTDVKIAIVSDDKVAEYTIKVVDTSVRDEVIFEDKNGYPVKDGSPLEIPWSKLSKCKPGAVLTVTSSFEGWVACRLDATGKGNLDASGHGHIPSFCEIATKDNGWWCEVGVGKQFHDQYFPNVKPGAEPSVWQWTLTKADLECIAKDKNDGTEGALGITVPDSKIFKVSVIVPAQ